MVAHPWNPPPPHTYTHTLPTNARQDLHFFRDNGGDMSVDPLDMRMASPVAPLDPARARTTPQGALRKEREGRDAKEGTLRDPHTRGHEELESEL